MCALVSLRRYQAAHDRILRTERSKTWLTTFQAGDYEIFRGTTFGHEVRRQTPRLPLASSAKVLFPRTETAQVAAPVIEARTVIEHVRYRFACDGNSLWGKLGAGVTIHLEEPWHGE